MAKKSKAGLRDIAPARLDEIATRESRGYRVECFNIKATSVCSTLHAKVAKNVCSRGCVNPTTAWRQDHATYKTFLVNPILLM